MSKNTKYTAWQVVMIRPLSFCSNPETKESNSFQQTLKLSSEETLKKAQTEFANFQTALSSKGIKIIQYEELSSAATPDALFPNNWFCHLPDKRAFIFPMQAQNRRLECRDDIVYALRPKEIIDLRFLIETDDFLEGTGSLILDHQYKIAYACQSPRTTLHALEVFSEISGYKIIAFDSVDSKNQPIYHTNVMMTLSPAHAVINLDSIPDHNQRNAVVFALQTSGRKIIEITSEQMNQFAGNMLFLRNEVNQFFWVCSLKAHEALSLQQIAQLESEGEFIFTDLNTIETTGGGGARCLMAEVFN
jgi:hypothetical protein